MKNNNYNHFESLEDKYKRDSRVIKKHKISGKSIFKLEKIMREKNEKTR